MKRLITTTSNSLRQVRHARVRATVQGTAQCPRLSVFRSNRGMHIQLVDDERGVTLFSAHTSDQAKAMAGKTAKVAAAYGAGQQLGAKAKAAGITTAVFDRGGYRYHGRVAAVADGARAGGLNF